MKDPIIAAYLEDFIKEFGVRELKEPEQFELFINYCVISRKYTEPFEPEEVSVGGGGDLGIDGLGIFVNEHLVQTAMEADFFKKTLRRLDVEFVFIQSKTSTSFDGGEIGTFIHGVRQFFNQTLPSGTNQGITDSFDVKEHIYRSCIDMGRSPTCRMFYVSLGTWKDDVSLRARVDQGITDIRSTGLFETVDFVVVDVDGIKKLYREVKNKFVREILFDKHTILPKIDAVQEAYIGIIPALEYMKLLCDDDGLLNRRIFYDNVRDFQGNNQVNSEIRNTILNKTQNGRFVLLNNGVTVVARNVLKVGASFRLEDYQIVNGCQTSHVLYLHRDHLTDQTYLSFKLIVTDDADVTNHVIQGTNRQTEIRPEAFESLSPFQKELEENYAAMGRRMASSLFYERRSKQYGHLGLGREHIITMPAQVKCFVAMFLNEPQSTHRYYGELLNSYRNRIFNESDRMLPYVTAGAALAATERLFNKGVLPRSSKYARYQILMVFRIQNGSGEMPKMNSKAIDKYCESLISLINDEDRCATAFRNANRTVESVRETQGAWCEGRGRPERTKAFTSALVKAASQRPRRG